MHICTYTVLKYDNYRHEHTGIQAMLMKGHIILILQKTYQRTHRILEKRHRTLRNNLLSRLVTRNTHILQYRIFVLFVAWINHICIDNLATPLYDLVTEHYLGHFAVATDRTWFTPIFYFLNLYEITRASLV